MTPGKTAGKVRVRMHGDRTTTDGEGRLVGEGTRSVVIDGRLVGPGEEATVTAADAETLVREGYAERV